MRWWARIVCAGVLGLAPAGARVRAAEPSAAPSEVVPPKLLDRVELVYPEELLDQTPPPAGTVVVKVTISVEGVPTDLVVEQSVHPQLDALVVEAVAKLRYEPARADGRPVPVIVRLPIEVAPPEKSEPSAPVDDAEPRDPAPGGQADGNPQAQPIAPPQDAAGPVRLQGEILEAGQRTPVSGATILVVPADPDLRPGRIRKRRYGEQPDPPWQVRAWSDPNGRFEARGIPSGRVHVVISLAGYERLEYVEVLPPGDSLTVRYFVTRSSDNPYRTVVRARRDPREEVTRRTIVVEEINNLPGTQGDALKSIQNFPGVARPPFGAGLLVIRGSDPTDSAVYLAEHEIPQLFHFGGLTSVFNSDILERIDFMPGNFDARFGDAIGGVIDVAPRKGRRDGYHGYIDSDLFDTGALFEGPVGKGSFVLSARRSYIDLLLPAFIPDDAGIDLVVAPRYWDYQALFDYPVSRGNLSVKVFGSDDRTRLVAPEANEVEGDDRDRFETAFAFHRADLAYTNRRGPWSFLISPSYRFDSADVAISRFFRFSIRSHSASARAEITYGRTPRFAWTVGAQIFGGSFAIDAEAPPVPVDGTGSTDMRLGVTSKDNLFAPAVYSTIKIGIGERFTLYPSTRVTYYSVAEGSFAVDPRLRFVAQLGPRMRLRGGVGRYSQFPDPPEWNPVFGNSRVGPESALHTSLALSREFDHAITVEVTAFYKYVWDLATRSTWVVQRDGGTIGPENTANHGTGRIYGAEFFVRKDLTRNLFGWFSYTLSRSERRQSPDKDYILFDLDQTHILTLLAVYRLPKNWQVGARFRLVSGNPYTPVDNAVFDASRGGYIPIEGEPNSARVPVFHQLDLRVDKKFVWPRVMLTAYLDIQNVYNHQNAEFIDNSFDYRERAPISSLPIIPSIGLKLEF